MKGRIGLATVIATVIAVVLGAAPALAGPFPDSVPLPDDFAPEGIAVGAGSTFYVGSLTTGDIYRGDLRSAAGGVFIDAPPGRAAVGLKADQAHRLLFVAGGATGAAYVYDLRSGAPGRDVPVRSKR